MRRRLGDIVAALERRGCKVVVRHGAVHGDVERLAHDAEPEFDVIVAAGGDGAVNAVVNGMAEKPRDLAVLPFGTANVLAREICLPRRSDSLAALIADAPAQPVWPGRIGNRLFLTVAGSAGLPFSGRFSGAWSGTAAPSCRFAPTAPRTARPR